MMGGGRGGGMGFGRNTLLTEEEKKNKPKITWPLLKRIFSYLIPYWPRLLLVFLAILASSICGLLPSLLTGQMIDKGLIGQDFSILVQLIAASLGVLLVSNLIGVSESYLNTWIAQHIIYDMKNQMYDHLQQMSHRFYSTQKQGDIITRMTSDINGVQSVISGTLTNILSNIVVVITTGAALYQKNWILATIGIIVVPLFLIPTKKVGATRWTIALKTQAKNDEANQVLNETLSVSGQLLVKLFTNEDREYQKYEKINREATALTVKESMAGRWFRMTMNTFINLGPLLIYLAGGYLIIKRGVTSLSVGDITVMVSLLTRLYAPVNSLLNIQVDVIRSMALFNRIFDYFDMPVEIQNKPDATIPDHLEGTLSFEHVDFSYDADQPILKDVNFTITKGHSVAIVGASGAGKSTIINLIPRLYDVTGGAIRLDGHDLRDLDLHYLRSNIGMVTQDTYLFNGTIRDNLLYANPNATQPQIEEACKKANIHDFIVSLPAGYDTPVGNRGIKLSGGEKQRVSIARVILKDPMILILDEATSSLDSISESQIQDAIDPLLQGRTSIVIAHRLSTIMAADEILVADSGRIVERGSHEELVVKDGIYKMLYETQFKKDPSHKVT